MFNLFPLSTALVVVTCLTTGLAACSTAPATTSKRAEHNYAFGKPAGTSSQITPVVAQSPAEGSGPAHTAHIVYFDYDSYTVRSADRGTLESHAKWLRNNPQQTLSLQGHTDSRGGIEYNLALGQKRAEAVRKSLQLLGASPTRVEAVSYGKERLADNASSETAHQRNRRVEFKYR
ncbi:OmpA family protein [Comamonas composti]|uniref:OmpA family protein n=1 Tax=Comamonas composti TaxID=408558 RepID=UPI00042976E6|nr:OmpA family protein [Comamonas composti]